MSTCHACALALENPDSGAYRAGCHGCDVRFLSKAPRFVREDRYAKVEDVAQREQLIAEVNAEFARRQALRRAK